MILNEPIRCQGMLAGLLVHTAWRSIWITNRLLYVCHISFVADEFEKSREFWQDVHTSAHPPHARGHRHLGDELSRGRVLQLQLCESLLRLPAMRESHLVTVAIVDTEPPGDWHYNHTAPDIPSKPLWHHWWPRSKSPSMPVASAKTRPVSSPWAIMNDVGDNRLCGR